MNMAKTAKTFHLPKDIPEPLWLLIASEFLQMLP